MSAPDHNIFGHEEYHNSHHDLDQWVYVEADSSRRPPVYNADNCSHADLSGYTNGVTQPAASPQQGYHFENHAKPWHQPPPHSYASSTASVPCPEGVEREDPNLAVAHTFLPLGPDTGLNEIPHRRSASFHSDMSYQMRRFLVDQQKDQPRRSASPPAQDKFLPQDIYIQSSKKKIKDKKRSKPSYQSFTSYSSEDQGFVGWGVEPTAYTGEWVEDERFGYCRDGFGYSSTLSGMTDELNGE